MVQNWQNLQMERMQMVRLKGRSVVSRLDLRLSGAEGPLVHLSRRMDQPRHLFQCLWMGDLWKARNRQWAGQRKERQSCLEGMSLV
jgi:hypothetical protein